MALAGSRRPPRQDGLFVDYKDVLDQAVINERHRILREIRARVGRIQTTRERSGSYSRDPRSAEDFKKDVLRELEYTEEGS